MSDEQEYRQRRGKGISWQMVNKTCYGNSITSGFTIDDLDKKPLAEASDIYEKIFVLVRSALEKNESYCMDVEEERLECCQTITDAIKESGILRSTGP